VRTVSPSTRLAAIGRAGPHVVSSADGLIVVPTPDAVRTGHNLLGSAAEVICRMHPMAPPAMDPATMLPTMTACAAQGCAGFKYYNHILMQRAVHTAVSQAIAERGR